MSEGEKVYKLRNKLSGQWVQRGRSRPPSFEWSHPAIPRLTVKKFPETYEYVEFTLSNPRVVT
jgi:hypothetical protein